MIAQAAQRTHDAQYAWAIFVPMITADMQYIWLVAGNAEGGQSGDDGRARKRMIRMIETVSDQCRALRSESSNALHIGLGCA